MHLKDPLMFHLLRSWALGYSNPWQAGKEFVADPASRGALMEAVVGSHLKRRFGPFLHYWRNAKEVDFLGFQERHLSAVVEVKYQPEPPQETLAAVSELGGGLVISAGSARLDSQRRVCVIPLPVFLALL